MARLAAPLGIVAIGFALIAGLAQAGAAADGELRLIGSFSSPVYVTAPPGDGERLFVVEQAGRIRVVQAGVVLPTPFLDITGPVLDDVGERGLLSLAFAPDYPVSGLFYVYYTAAAPAGAVTIAEHRRSGNPDVAEATGRIVLSINHPAGNHNGGQLQFGRDGYLYVATGDGGGGGDPERNGQKLDSLLGKLLRINPRVGPNGEAYTAPADNPFVGQAGARPELWAYGLRNPWRFSFDRETGDLTLGDVGQGAWEEIDFVPAGFGAGHGVNFGWSCWEGRHEYQPNHGEAACAPARAGHTRPVWEYSSASGPACSVTGGYVVRDPALPALQGKYVYGDYCDARIWSVSLQLPDATENRDTGLTVANLTSFGEDACGRLYAASHSGPVYRLEAPGSPGANTCTPAVEPTPPPPPPGSPPPPASPPPQPQPVAPPAPLPARPATGCRVPRVIGLRVPRARTSIRRGRCRVGRIGYRHTARARGRVHTQAPRPGARRPVGAAVRFTVSRGRRR